MRPTRLRSMLGAGVALALLSCLSDTTGEATAAVGDPPKRLAASPYFTAVRDLGMVPFKGYTYFFADDDVHGMELWRSDGTPAGTTLFADLTPGDAASDTAFASAVNRGLGEMVATRDRLCFLTFSGTESTLWYTDGSAAPKAALTGIPYFRSGLITDGGGIHIVGGSTLFHLADGATTVQQLPDQRSGLGVGMQGAVLDGVVYYANSDGEHGFELWRSDMTPAGTRMVKDIRAGAADSNPLAFVASGNRVYFIADDGFHGTELWTTDGTSEGTKLVLDLRTGTADGKIGDWRAVGDTFWFTGVEQGESHATLWRTRGAAPVVAGVFPTAETALIPGSFGEHVAASQGSDLRTTAGGPLQPLTARYNRSPTTTVGSDLYFRAWTNDYKSATAIYRSQGTPGSTIAVRTFAEAYPQFMTVAGSRLLYFTRESGDPGFRPGFYTPAPTSTKVTVAVRPGQLPFGSRKRARVTVTVSGLPGSTVVLKDGRRQLDTLRLTGQRATYVMPRRLPAGRHLLSATLKPTELTLGARDTTVLVIKR